MVKKIALISISFLLGTIIFSAMRTESNVFQTQKIERSNGMPILDEKDPLLARITNRIPVGHRSGEYIKWLQSSFKIQTNENSGSGTLCYYNSNTNDAYVISCGHLWNGMGSNTNEQANIITWYHNNKKLSVPRTYSAKKIFHSNAAGFDCSLLVFKPDWIPNIYYPISRREVKRGERLHSIGSDKGSETADYIVEVIEIGTDPRGGKAVVTQYNSPRPGRSGGGLIDGKGYFLGICWATSNKDGTGIGYFTPSSAINSVFTREGYAGLLNLTLPGIARRIPIIDHNNPNKKYGDDYIIFPN